jgi:hypothetical protein
MKTIPISAWFVASNGYRYYVSVSRWQTLNLWRHIAGRNGL